MSTSSQLSTTVFLVSTSASSSSEEPTTTRAGGESFLCCEEWGKSTGEHCEVKLPLRPQWWGCVTPLSSSSASLPVLSTGARPTLLAGSRWRAPSWRHWD